MGWQGEVLPSYSGKTGQKCNLVFLAGSKLHMPFCPLELTRRALTSPGGSF